jgi:hypothetical protein
MLGISGYWIWRNRRAAESESLPLFISLVMAGVLLSLTNAWEHYWLFCLPVIGFAIREIWNRGEVNFQAIFVFTMSFFFLMKLTRFYTDTTAGRIFSGSQTAGMLMLWIWLLYRLHFSHRIEKS